MAKMTYFQNLYFLTLPWAEEFYHLFHLRNYICKEKLLQNLSAVLTADEQ